MDMHEWSKWATTLAQYPGAGTEQGLGYSVLGLNGEAGEVADHVKKAIRDDGGDLTDHRRLAVLKELGDVLWYVNAVANDIGYTLNDVALLNKAKLNDRQARGVLGGEGDDR